MGTKSKSIELARIANDKTGEARTMLRELEGTPKAKRSSNPRWPSRFLAVAYGEEKRRGVRRTDASATAGAGREGL